MKRALLFTFAAFLVMAKVGPLKAPVIARADDTMEELQKHVEKLRGQQQSGARVAPQGTVQRPQGGIAAVERALQQAPATPSQDQNIEIARTHVRSSEGVPFPNPEEVVLPPPPPLPPLPTSIMVAEPAQPEYKRPPRCEGDQNICEALSFEYGPSEEVVVSDVIYLPEDLMPVDPMEVFGSKANTFTYGPKSGDGVNIRMYYDAVPCVPYRIRFTNKAKYVDRGNFALKNYDKQPSGRGQYHTWMQQKLFLGK
jgi:hypothetical protein